jgi:hypothetical protein
VQEFPPSSDMGGSDFRVRSPSAILRIHGIDHLSESDRPVYPWVYQPFRPKRKATQPVRVRTHVI